MMQFKAETGIHVSHGDQKLSFSVDASCIICSESLEKVPIKSWCMTLFLTLTIQSQLKVSTLFLAVIIVQLSWVSVSSISFKLSLSATKVCKDCLAEWLRRGT